MTKRTVVGIMIVVVLAILSVAVFVLIWLMSAKQPAAQSSTPSGSNCGGISGIICPAGYTCSYPDNANYPDATGHCILK